jgi:outer membrane protein assembly factor BamB
VATPPAGPGKPRSSGAADGTIYAASNAGILHALDPITGADRWTFDSGYRAAGSNLSTGDPLIAFSPAGMAL